MMSIASQVFLLFYAVIYGALFTISDRWRPFSMRHGSRQGAWRSVLSVIFFGVFPGLYFIWAFLRWLTIQGKDPVVLAVAIYSVAPLYAFHFIWSWFVRAHKDIFYSAEEQSREPVCKALGWVGSERVPTWIRALMVAFFLIGPIALLVFVPIGRSSVEGENDMKQAIAAIVNMREWVLVAITAVYVVLTYFVLKTMRDEGRKAAVTRTHELLWRVMMDYRSTEMLLAVDGLWRFYDIHKRDFLEEYERLREYEHIKIMELPPGQQTAAVTGTLHYQRRVVSHFYQFLATLHDLGAIADSMLYSYWGERTLRIINDIIIPVEIMLAEKFKTDSPGFRATIESLQRLYEGSNQRIPT
jgi:hypothetical protein